LRDKEAKILAMGGEKSGRKTAHGENSPLVNALDLLFDAGTFRELDMFVTIAARQYWG
jgi:acetyl-CoA carboxylase carboxyltransferase component